MQVKRKMSSHSLENSIEIKWILYDNWIDRHTYYINDKYINKKNCN